MAGITFRDNSVLVKTALRKALGTWLEESAYVIESQAKQNTAVDTGQTKNAWSHTVSTSKGEAFVGNSLENAVWEEYGTGEYALYGNGRKGGWFYVDKEGNGHFTHGKRPRRMLHNAFHTKKAAVIRRAEEIIKGELND